MLFRLSTEFLRRHWAATLLIVLLQVAQSLISLTLPGLTADIIDKGVVAGNIGYIWRTGGVMIGITAAQGLCLGIVIYFASKLAMELGRELREKTYEKVLTFGTSDIREFGASSLITRATNDAQQVQMLMFTTLTLLVTAPIMGIGGIIMAIRQDAKLSLLLLVVVPVLAIVVGVLMGALSPMFKRKQQRLDETGRVFREQLSGVRVIRAFNRQKEERERFNDANTRLRNQSLQIAYTFAVMFPAISLIVGFSFTAVLWFGAGRINAGAMQIGALIAFINYLMQIMTSVLMAGMMFMIVPRARVSAERITAVLNTTPAVQNPAQPKALPTEPAVFKFVGAGVQFGDAEQPSLTGVDLILKPGTTTAVVGPTGSGKSTLVNLLPRFIDPSCGQVLLNDIDIRDLDLAQLRTKIALVPQAGYLFHGTVATNVSSLPAEQVTDLVRERVRKCLTIADAWSFIKDRDGQENGPVEAGGAGFSGGQRQRITIARAVYQVLFGAAELLVIDDAFSALDLETDARVRTRLAHEVPDCAKLIVAQRLSTINSAQQIIVLDEGRVAGIGTHNYLLQHCDTYQEIAASQEDGEAA